MENKEAIGIIEDLEKALEDNGIIAQAPEIKEALDLAIEVLEKEIPKRGTIDGKSEMLC